MGMHDQGKPNIVAETTDSFLLTLERANKTSQ